MALAAAWRAAASLLILGACRTAARHDVPALLTSPSAATRGELERVVGRVLGGAPVTLADDALTRDGVLIVERAKARAPDGLPLQGRETGKPEHFRLVLAGARCVLVHEGSGRRETLTTATCRPQ